MFHVMLLLAEGSVIQSVESFIFVLWWVQHWRVRDASARGSVLRVFYYSSVTGQIVLYFNQAGRQNYNIKWVLIWELII